MPHTTKICTKCGKTFEGKGARCPEHRLTYFEGFIRKPHEEAFYTSKAWKALRHQFIRKNPLCKMCSDEGRKSLAEVVDHIENLRDHWDKRFDWLNLQSLCKRHHASKSASNEKHI